MGVGLLCELVAVQIDLIGSPPVSSAAAAAEAAWPEAEDAAEDAASEAYHTAQQQEQANDQKKKARINGGGTWLIPLSALMYASELSRNTTNAMGLPKTTHQVFSRPCPKEACKAF